MMTHPELSTEQPSQVPSGNSATRLILHADDFGMSSAVNRGILQGFSRGLLTSTSVLTNAPACGEALAEWKELLVRQASGRLESWAARSHLDDSGTCFDLGVHLNLTQGRPLTGNKFPSSLLDRRGCFVGIFQLLPRLVLLGSRYREQLANELCAQIEILLEQGLAPTHLNGHQYVELMPVVSEIIPELLARYRISKVRVAWECGLSRSALGAQCRPVQWGLAQVKRLFAFRFLTQMRRAGIQHPDAFRGTAHAGRVDLTVLRAFLHGVRGKTLEVGLHPGASVAAGPVSDEWHDPLTDNRVRELEMLTASELVELLVAANVRLGRIADLPAARARSAA